jgi:hypothetical protein
VPRAARNRLAAGHTVEMSLDTAQLASLATGLDDLTRRITALADSYAGSPRDDVASDLYEVERNLQAATRRLHALLDKL